MYIYSQALDAVQLSLSAPLGCDSVLAAPPLLLNKVLLLWGQGVRAHHQLKVTAREVRQLIHSERERHLEIQMAIKDCIKMHNIM